MAPDWQPRHVELSGPSYAGVMVSGTGVCPMVAKAVACGRFFGLLIGEPIEPMPESDAALMIQSTFRRDRAKKDVLEKRKYDEAAMVIGRKGTALLAKRALDGANLQREAAAQMEAATRVQALQRRRMVQRDMRRTCAEGEVMKNAFRSRSSLHVEAAPPPAMKPKPPAPRRVGGGFTRSSTKARPQGTRST